MTDDSNDGEEQSDSEQPDGSLSGIAGTLGTIHRVRQLVQETEDAEVSASSIKAMLGGYQAAEGTVTTYQDVASIVAKVGAAQSIQNSLTPAMAVLANSDTLNYAGTAAALQRIVEQEEELSRNLSAIAHLTQNTETIQSALAAAAKASDAGELPDSLISDLATLRATKVHLTGLSSQQVGKPLFDEPDETDHSPDDRREPSEQDGEIEEPNTTGSDEEGEQEPTTRGGLKEVKTELEAGGTIDATVESTRGQRAPNPGFAETTVDATPPNIEFSYEIPTLVVRSILNSGQAYHWFCGLRSEYQTAVVGVLLIHATVSMGFPLYAPAAAVVAPAVRVAVIESDEKEAEADDQ